MGSRNGTTVQCIVRHRMHRTSLMLSVDHESIIYRCESLRFSHNQEGERDRLGEESSLRSFSD